MEVAETYILVFHLLEMIRITCIAVVHGDVDAWSNGTMRTVEIIRVDGLGGHCHAWQGLLQSLVGKGEVGGWHIDE